MIVNLTTSQETDSGINEIPVSVNVDKVTLVIPYVGDDSHLFYETTIRMEHTFLHVREEYKDVVRLMEKAYKDRYKGITIGMYRTGPGA